MIVTSNKHHIDRLTSVKFELLLMIHPKVIVKSIFDIIWQDGINIQFVINNKLLCLDQLNLAQISTVEVVISCENFIHFHCSYQPQQRRIITHEIGFIFNSSNAEVIHVRSISFRVTREGALWSLGCSSVFLWMYSCTTVYYQYHLKGAFFKVQNPQN